MLQAYRPSEVKNWGTCLKIVNSPMATPINYEYLIYKMNSEIHNNIIKINLK